ncbi:MAG: GTP cyclohydrolase II [Vicinamibacterales bacterium]
MRLVLTGQPRVQRVSTAALPTEYGQFTVHVFEDALEGLTHVAMVCGDLGNGEDVLARLHSACLTGDIFHSARCDCGPQLETAMRLVAAEGRGMILYMDQEGRGIGLANKIRAYALQDQGYDTVEANHRLGFDADLRDYTGAMLIFHDLGVKSVRLLSNNPRKLAAFDTGGLQVSERVPIEIPVSDSTRRYLQTKRDKLGHQLSSV